MRQPYPWMGLEWPQGQDIDPNMLYGTVRPRAGAQGFFDAAMPPETAPERQAPPMPPPRGPQGPMVAGNVSRETPSDQGPNFIQRLSQDPLVMGGLMMALEGASGGNGVAGFTKGAGSAAGIQEAYMRNLQLQRKTEQEKRVKELMEGGQMGDVPPPLLAIAKATGDVAPITQYLMKTGGTDDIKEFEYAKRSGFEGTFTQWMEKKKSMAGEYAKQLVYGQNEAGDVIPMQAGSKGDLKASGLPPGVKMQRDPIKFDAGTHFVLMDPTTRQPIATIPKNVDEVARQKEAGGLQGKAQGDLPAMESLGTDIIKKIEAVSADKNLDKMIGYRGYLPNVTPEARTLASKIEQLKGQAFLQAFQSLKGAGAITEMEGAKATAAMARMQEMVQSGQDYREALADFKSEVQRLMDVKRAQARGGRPAPAESVVPKQGETTAKRLRFNPATGDLE